MANAEITSASGSLGASGLKSLMTLLADQFIQAARVRGKMAMRINTAAASGAVASFGDTARVLLSTPDVSGATLSTTLTDGNSLVLNDAPGTSIDVVLNTHRTAAFGYTQIAQALDGGASFPEVLQSRLYALFNAIEADIGAVVTSGFTTNVVGTYNSAMTEANAVLAMGNLFSQGVPEGDPLWAFVNQGANAWQALVQLAGFREFQITGVESPIVSANYGGGTQWHGASYVMSQAVKRSTNNIDNFICHKDAICMAMRPLPLPSDTGPTAANFRDPDSGIEFQILKQWNTTKLADEFIVHALYGISVGQEKYGCLFKS